MPVIFLTAKTQKADRRRFYASGIKGFITKPFDPTTLASQISGFLGIGITSDQRRVFKPQSGLTQICSVGRYWEHLRKPSVR
ncbi:hypothetical protein [Pleurocapsa sp. CCALA 161]|uniref:hypothetical protein n=1 Tax=Pleurocapsa sp. CCALA 161 TaxID=2107688 RepID=UPI003517A477